MGHYVDVKCPTCGGAKFLDDHYDYEIGKMLMRNCPDCSALGVISVWTDDDRLF